MGLSIYPSGSMVKATVRIGGVCEVGDIGELVEFADGLWTVSFDFHGDLIEHQMSESQFVPLQTERVSVPLLRVFRGDEE